MSESTHRGRLPEGLAERLLAATDEGVAIVAGEDPAHPVAWVNPAFERITGFRADQLVGLNLRVLQGGDREQPGLAELRDAIAGWRGCRVLLRNYRPDGEPYWHQLRVEPFTDAHGARWWAGFSRDVTAQREMELQLGRRSEELGDAQRRLAEVDPIDRLTGLQSAPSFEVALELGWFSCARDRRALALFVFAPDYFNVYLDTFGRVAGDSCLRMLARSVGAAFRRASDVAARIDDAQFAALGMDMDRDQLEPHSRRVCDRVRALAIHNPHAPLARNLTVSAVVMLVRPGRMADWRGLLAQARQELAAAQAAGIEQVVVSEFGAPAD